LYYDGPNHYLNFIKTTVYDSTGNNNGRLDPGETVDLTAALKNIGGVDFTNLTTILQSTDQYVTINDNSGIFGSLMVDSTKENINDKYTVSVSASAPSGHYAPFRLIATEGTFADTFEFSLTIGSFNFLVWNPDPNGGSGSTIYDILTLHNYGGNYTQTLMNEPTLDIYQSIFVCCGMYPNNYRITNGGAEAIALVNYLNAGGRVYLEGGDVWYYDPLTGGYNFGSLFGLVGAEDGTSDLTIVAGCFGTFTQNMGFGYGGENSYVDHINPTTGFAVFNSGLMGYNCGIANNAITYRTVGTSFELGGLIDGIGVSTKMILLDSIMHFFGIIHTSVEETNEPNVISQGLKIYPNPFTNHLIINVPKSSLANSHSTIRIYDATGKLVRSFSASSVVRKASSNIIWDGKNESGVKLPAGVYFIDVNIENQRLTKRAVLVN
jgi:hypothetical protein